MTMLLSRTPIAAVFLSLLAGTAGLSAQQSVAPAAPPNTVRVWGATALAPLIGRWEGAFQAAHPEVKFTNAFHPPAAVMAGLYNGVADVAVMGREVWPVETMAFHWVFQEQPFAIAVVTGGLNAPGQSYSPIVMVNARNPLAAISLAQLDAIYGSEHRAAPANARTWGDLGLTGAWAGKPIHVYGYGPEDALGVYFRHDVLKMDFKPNPASHLLSDHDGSAGSAASRILRAVAEDPYAIGYASAPGATTGRLKVLAVTAADGPIAPTEASVEDHTYPLTRSLSMVIHRVPGKPMEGKLEAFLRFVLTPEAQAMVRPGEGFLPLTPGLAAKQREKLDAPMKADAAPEEKE